MTQIWAHRGANVVAPENTVEAFSAAMEMGADGVELDVQRTSDGHVVVCHDETIDRTSTGKGSIADSTLAELRRHDFGNQMSRFASGVRLPTLEDVLDLLHGTGAVINIELKTTAQLYPGIAQQVFEQVRSWGMADRVVYSSFNHYTLREIQATGTSSPIGLLYGEALWDPWRYAIDFGAQALHPPRQVLAAPGMVDSCHDAGIKVHPWTVDDEQELAWLFGLGVDAVITNTPEVARRVRAAASLD